MEVATQGLWGEENPMELQSYSPELPQLWGLARQDSTVLLGSRASFLTFYPRARSERQESSEYAQASCLYWTPAGQRHQLPAPPTPAQPHSQEQGLAGCH